MNDHTGGSLIWRDRFLLLAVWVFILLVGMGIWAFSPSENVEGQKLPIPIAVVLLLLLISLPAILIILSLTERGRSLLAISRSYFQSSAVYAILLFALALGQILYIFVDIEPLSIAPFLMMIIAAAVLLHLFLGRESIDTRAVVLMAIWFASIVLLRLSLTELLAAGSFWSTSWRYQAMVLGLSALIALLALLPLVLLSGRLRRVLEAIVDRFSGYFGWLFVLAIGATFVLMVLNQSTDFEILQAVIISRISIILAAVSALGYASRKDSNATEAFTTINFSDLQRPLYIGILAAVALAFLLVSSQIKHTDNDSGFKSNIGPDGLAYLTIAQKYAEGNPVVRGYWSPLISWLIAPAIALGIDPVAFHSVLTQAATLAWMLITVLIARRWGLSRIARVALAVLILLISLEHGFFPINPDLLGAVIFSIGIYILSDPNLTERPVRNGVIFGVVIALSYYAKYYNLAFFIVFIPALFLLLIAKGEKTANALKFILYSLATAALVVLPWIIGIWSRYGAVSLTTSAVINRAIVGPQQQGHSCWDIRLCDAPDDVLFPGEDNQLQDYADVGWSPFENISLLRHQIQHIWRMSEQWMATTPIGPDLIPPVSLAILVLLPLLYWKNAEKRYLYSLGFTIFALYAAGYLLTFAFPLRFYFAIIPVAWLVGYASIEHVLSAVCPLSQHRRTYPYLKPLILIIPILAFSWFAQIRFRAFSETEPGPCLEEAAEVMAGNLVPPIAGTDVSTNYFAYYSGVPTRGMIRPDKPASEVDSQLGAFEIRTLVTPSGTDLEEELTDRYAYLSLQTVEVCGELYEVLQIP